MHVGPATTDALVMGGKTIILESSAGSHVDEGGRVIFRRDGGVGQTGQKGQDRTWTLGDNDRVAEQRSGGRGRMLATSMTTAHPFDRRARACPASHRAISILRGCRTDELTPTPCFAAPSNAKSHVAMKKKRFSVSLARVEKTSMT